MKKFVLFIVLALTCSNLFGQETETRQVGSFTGVKSAEGVDVYLTKGDKELVKIEATGVRTKEVITEISGSYLKIHMDDGNHRKASVKVYVTYVKLNKLSASSAGSIFSQGTIKSDDMEISASSAGSVEVSLETSTLTASASSAGELELNGKSRSATFEASSAGEINAYDLECESVSAEASSAGDVKISVTKSLNADASSGGSIRYKGNPDKSITESSSGGSVKKSN